MGLEYEKPIEFAEQELSTLESSWMVNLLITPLGDGLFRAEVNGDKVICEADVQWQDDQGDWNLPSHIDGTEVYRVDEDFDGTHVVIGEPNDIIEFKGIEDNTFWNWLAQTDFYDEQHHSVIREKWNREFAPQRQ